MQGNSPDEEYVDPHGECRHEINRLQEALRPFIKAWDWVTDGNKHAHLSLAQLSNMAGHEITAADYQRVKRALSQTNQ